jgi:phage terminase large subunit-like protein
MPGKGADFAAINANAHYKVKQPEAKLGMIQSGLRQLNNRQAENMVPQLIGQFNVDGLIAVFNVVA